MPAVRPPHNLLSVLLLLCYGAALYLCSCSHGNDHTTAAHQKTLPIEVSAKADPTTATTNQTITFTLTVLYRSDITVQLPEIGSRIAGLRIVDFGEQGPRESDNRKEYVKWFSLRGDIAGSYIIPSLTVFWSAPDNATPHEVHTPQIFIEISGSPTKPEQADICDIKPPVEVPRAVPWWALAAGAVLLSAGSGCAILFYKRRMQRRKNELKKAAHEIAFEALEKLRQEQLIEQGLVQEYYFRLSDIFRRYIEHRFTLPAVEQTTQELLPEIMNLDTHPKIKTQMREVLTQADMVKFAKYLPADQEITEHYNKVIEIIAATKIEPPPDQQQHTTKNTVQSAPEMHVQQHQKNQHQGGL